MSKQVGLRLAFPPWGVGGGGGRVCFKRGFDKKFLGMIVILIRIMGR